MGRPGCLQRTVIRPPLGRQPPRLGSALGRSPGGVGTRSSVIGKRKDQPPRIADSRHRLARGGPEAQRHAACQQHRQGEAQARALATPQIGHCASASHRSGRLSGRRWKKREMRSRSFGLARQSGRVRGSRTPASDSRRGLSSSPQQLSMQARQADLRPNNAAGSARTSRCPIGGKVPRYRRNSSSNPVRSIPARNTPPAGWAVPARTGGEPRLFEGLANRPGHGGRPHDVSA
jgi:hypothetical protein